MRLGPCPISVESYRATSSIAPLCLTTSKYGSHYGNFLWAKFEPFVILLCMFLWLCVLPELKPIQYIDIYKRYFASSEFNLCLSFWSCWMISKNSGKALLIIMTMKFLLARRKLTNGQNQMDTHTDFFTWLFSVLDISISFGFPKFSIWCPDLYFSLRQEDSEAEE